MLAYGVIGNTAGFGPVVLGSSPSRPTSKMEVPILKSIGIFFYYLFDPVRTKKYQIAIAQLSTWMI